MTAHVFQMVSYSALDGRQKEAYNLQKVSSVLADYGFITIRLSSDWGGADFIAQHIDGVTFLKVQLKARMTFDKKYIGKGLHICFPSGDAWYLYPHDELLAQAFDLEIIKDSKSWKDGDYSFATISKKLAALLLPHKIGS
jgi:hypothetical protein